MSWYSENYKQRSPVAVDIEVVGSPVDVTVTVPSEWSAFWDNIRVDAFDAILVDSNNLLLTFKRSAFNYANRQLTLQVDNLPHDNTSLTAQIFLYWNYAGATDLTSVFTASGPRTSKIFVGSPSGKIVLPDRSGSNAANAPTSIITKAANEEGYVWFEYRSLLNKRTSQYSKSLFFEEVKHAVVFSYDSSGTDSNTRYTKIETVFSNGYVGVFLKAGVADNTYLIGARLKTTLTQQIEVKAFLQIKNKYPPS